MTRGKIRMVEIIEAANGYLVVCGGFVETKFADITNLYCLRSETLHHGGVCQNNSCSPQSGLSYTSHIGNRHQL